MIVGCKARFCHFLRSLQFLVPFLTSLHIVSLDNYLSIYSLCSLLLFVATIVHCCSFFELSFSRGCFFFFFSRSLLYLFPSSFYQHFLGRPFTFFLSLKHSFILFLWRYSSLLFSSGNVFIISFWRLFSISLFKLSFFAFSPYFVEYLFCSGFLTFLLIL